MPKADSAKTASGRKLRLLIRGVALLLLALGMVGWWRLLQGQAGLPFGPPSWTGQAATTVAPKRGTSVQPQTGISYQTIELNAGSQQVILDIADTPAKQELGLGKRSGMAPDRGMIFSYAKPGELCFWMKDMKFPIDIVWLDANKKVIKIEPNLSPDTYPQTYCPDKPAQYVVELYPGAAQASFKLGDKLPLPADL